VLLLSQAYVHWVAGNVDETGCIKVGMRNIRQAKTRKTLTLRNVIAANWGGVAVALC